MILWGGDTDGPRAVPGRYQVRLSAGGTSLTRPFELRKDPRLATTDEDFAKQFALLSQIRDELNATHEGITRLRAVRDQAKPPPIERRARRRRRRSPRRPTRSRRS